MTDSYKTVSRNVRYRTAITVQLNIPPVWGEKTMAAAAAVAVHVPSLALCSTSFVRRRWLITAGMIGNWPLENNLLRGLPHGHTPLPQPPSSLHPSSSPHNNMLDMCITQDATPYLNEQMFDHFMTLCRASSSITAHCSVLTPSALVGKDSGKNIDLKFIKYWVFSYNLINDTYRGLVSVSSVFYFSEFYRYVKLSGHPSASDLEFKLYFCVLYDLTYLYIISVVPGFCHCYSKKVNVLVLQKALLMMFLGAAENLHQ